MTNKEHKKLSIKEFTKAAGIYEGNKADIAVLAVVTCRESRIL